MSKWEMVKLGDVCFSQTKSKIKAGEGLQFGEYKFFTSSNIQSKFLNTYNYEQQALIFGTGGNANIHHCDTPFATSTDCIVYFKLTDKIDLKYTYLYLLGNIHLLQSGFKGAGLKHISKDYIQNIEIPLPPLETQKKIADELDKISGLIEKRKSQIEKLDLLTNAKFVEMFGDPVTNEMGWEVKELSKVILFLTSGSRGWAKHYSENGEMFLTIKNIKNSKIMTHNIQYILAPTNKEAERTKVKENDLIISITADLGRTGVVDKKIADYGAYINQHLSLIRLNTKQINPFYISYFLESRAGKIQFESKNQSAVKAGLNFDAIKSLKVLIPPLDLQNKFAQYVEKIEKTRYNMEKGLEQLEVLYKERMQEYFE